MTHWLSWLLYGAAACSCAGALRALYLVARTPTPEAMPGEVRVRVRWQIGEATPRGDRLRLIGAGLLGLSALLAVLARELWHYAG